MGLFDATQTVVSMHSQGMHHAWTQLFFTILFSWMPWALATPVVMYLGRRFPPVRLRPVSIWFIHLGGVAIIDLVSAAWRAFMEVAMNPWVTRAARVSFTSLWSPSINNGLLAAIIFYASILAISYVLESRERISHQQAETARLNEQLSKAQLDALRHQLEPHFLFNALNAVAALVREERNDDAVDMIAGLSDLLRHVLQDCSKQEVMRTKHLLDALFRCVQRPLVEGADLLHELNQVVSPGDNGGAQKRFAPPPRFGTVPFERGRERIPIRARALLEIVDRFFLGARRGFPILRQGVFHAGTQRVQLGLWSAAWRSLGSIT